MKLEEIRRKINFIQPDDVIYYGERSHSGSVVCIIEKLDKKFFLKIMNNSSFKERRIDIICDTYRQLNIPSINVIDKGTIDDKIYVIYNFIDGDDLICLRNKMSVHDIYLVGHTVGSYEKKLASYPSKVQYVNVQKNIHDFTQEKTKKFYASYSKEILQIANFGIDDLKKIETIFTQLAKSFSNTEKELIHSDIKSGNVMINKQKQVVIVDIESLEYNYFPFNFRWSIYDIFNYSNKNEERAFYHGVLSGRYDEIPSELNKQILYILILKFFEESTNYLKKSNIKGLTDLMNFYEDIFNEIEIWKKGTAVDILSIITSYV